MNYQVSSSSGSEHTNHSDVTPRDVQVNEPRFGTRTEGSTNSGASELPNVEHTAMTPVRRNAGLEQSNAFGDIYDEYMF